MAIELPRDAVGREIPLDTQVLYDEEGNPQDVARFTYSPRNMFLDKRWEVVFLSAFDRYASEMYLNPPEPPDSWEKLDEDLDSCSASTQYTPCVYFSDSTGDCEKCSADPDRECLVQMIKHIALRIHKLRGED